MSCDFDTLLKCFLASCMISGEIPSSLYIGLKRCFDFWFFRMRFDDVRTDREFDYYGLSSLLFMKILFVNIFSFSMRMRLGDIDFFIGIFSSDF